MKPASAEKPFNLFYKSILHWILLKLTLDSIKKNNQLNFRERTLHNFQKVKTFLLTLGLLAAAHTAYAVEWGNIAAISETVDNRVCVYNIDGDADESIDCDANAPAIDVAGNMTVSGTISATTYYGDGSNLTGISAGASALASLTDVSATSPATGAVLRYDGTNWVNVNDLSSAISTTTITPNWPDAIRCINGTDVLYLWHSYSTSTGAHFYRHVYYGAEYNVGYTSAGNYSSTTGLSSSDCATNSWSISDLYAQGRAFNFIGNNGASTNLNEIGDVSATAPTDGQVLAWVNANSRWEPVASGGGDLDSLSDAEYDASSTYNLFLGQQYGTALVNNAKNVAIGKDALISLDDDNTANYYGDDNVAVGFSSMRATTQGYSNSALGAYSLYTNSTGSNNTAVGAYALRLNTTGLNNTAIGRSALFNNSTSNGSTAVGSFALFNNTAARNTAVGNDTLATNTSGTRNTAVGHEAYENLATGDDNIAMGQNAGRYIANGSTNNTVNHQSVYLGSAAKASVDGVTNEIVIGYNATGAGSNSVVLGNDSIATTALKGNVGIGTTSPSTTLHVSMPYASVYEQDVVLSLAQTGNNAGDAGPFIGFQANDESGYRAAIGGVKAGTKAGELLFFTHGNNGGDTWGTHIKERMRIDYDGNVGIGTTSPSTTLHVNGAVQMSAADSETCSTSTDTGKLRYNSSTGRMQICQ